jgi:hypothetical protein
VIWSYGDGNTGSGVITSHTYAAPGNYQVSLVAWNLCGNFDTITQNIQVCDSLIADFSFTTNVDSVFLDATGSIGSSQFFWELGDGTDTSGILVRHAYTTPGTKVIQLTVVNLCGDSVVISKNVKICLPPVADWTYSIISTGANGMQVQFDATATQNATNYFWDFGDGNTITGQVSPVHTYVTPGLFYRVTLRVSNDCGDEDVRRYRLSDIGMDELQEDGQIELYPNPASERVHLSWNLKRDKLSGIGLFDLSGKLILEISLNSSESGEYDLDVSALPAGAYMLRVEMGTAFSHIPLIVE